MSESIVSQYIPTTPSEVHESDLFMNALGEAAAGHFTNCVRGYLSQDEPAAASSFVFSFLAIPLSRLSDADWQRTMHAGCLPCGKDGCDCHVAKGAFFEGCDSAREKQKEVNAARRAEVIAHRAKIKQ